MVVEVETSLQLLRGVVPDPADFAHGAILALRPPE
jgi:hypothetical protein